MTKTIDQLNLFEGSRLRDIGINLAVENANVKSRNWQDIAYSFLLEYIKTNDVFMAEDVRIASDGIVPIPPSKRAWGIIFVTAKKNKVIKSIGFKTVQNPKAHRTPATLWSVSHI